LDTAIPMILYNLGIHCWIHLNLIKIELICILTKELISIYATILEFHHSIVINIV